MGQRVTPIPHIQSSAVWRQLSWSLNTHPESEVKIHSHLSTPPGSSLPCLPALSANTGSFHLLYLTHNWMARCPAPPAHRLLILAGLPHQPDCKPQESREQPDCGEVSDLTLRWWRRKAAKKQTNAETLRPQGHVLKDHVLNHTGQTQTHSTPVSPAPRLVFQILNSVSVQCPCRQSNSPRNDLLHLQDYCYYFLFLHLFPWNRELKV